MTFFKSTKIFLALFLFPLVTTAQKSETAFKKECLTIVNAFGKQDYRTLNKYINNATGVYIISRPGAIDALNHYDSLGTKAFSFYPYKSNGAKMSIRFGSAPRFDCGTEKWNKKGFYVDTARYNRLSELMDFLTKNQMRTYSADEESKAKELELKSRKIVYTELAKKHGIVFYLTLINKKWYLTLVDAVASDCGA